MRTARLRDAFSALVAAALPPGAFAAVMATGVVSIALTEHGHEALSAVLAALAVAGLSVIAMVVVVRLGRRLAPVSGSLRDPGVALPLFGAVAACAVLGARFATHRAVVVLLGVLGVVIWLVLVAVASRALRGRPFAELRGRARGAWLLPAVATAGLVITAADLATGGPVLIVAAAAGEVLGIGLYAGALALIVARTVAANSIGSELLAGDSWVVMGGLAICTLAGDRILGAVDGARSRGSVDGWLSGGVDGWLRPTTFACWVLATVMGAAVALAHARRTRPGSGSWSGVPRHDVFWWAGVFPLGMYSVATLATARQFHLRVLPGVSELFCWIAVFAWLVAAAGLVHTAVRLAAVRLAGDDDRTREAPGSEAPGS